MEIALPYGRDEEVIINVPDGNLAGVLSPLMLAGAADEA